ncbi:Satratoxin biosynthesis SC1 cluster protein 4 [Colletotrichum sidae]|uniref:Satratoxin biosynthesis SC1 cluster protein 4 n=1 Tax=Colletotrichum sidae TaxID=1347389 RepID=A0A4R8T6U3_9PEZI|nr:Satratoxin biosynthesis SC1 cluster protein 4 [Colletotrichum sidae]
MPESKVRFAESEGYSGHIVWQVNVALIVCTSTFVWLRLYVRAFVAKALGPDDVLALLGWGVLVTLSALDIRLVQYGSGAHLDTIPKEEFAIWFEGIVTNGLLYFVGTGLVRLSIVAFLPRLSQDRTFVCLAYATGLFVIAQTLGCLIYRLTQCSPISHLWKPPFFPGKNCVPPQNQNNMMVAHQVIGVILDFALMGLPIWVVYQKMLWSKKTVQVICVFSVGIFVAATGCVRLAMMKKRQFLDDPTFNMSTIGIWTDLEGHVGLWVASFPALQPLTRIVSFKMGFRSKLQSYGKEGPSKDAGRMRSNTETWSRKAGYIRNGSGIDGADNHSERGLVPQHGEDMGVEMDTMKTEASGIQKQVDVEVRIDRAASRKQADQGPGKIANSWLVD